MDRTAETADAIRRKRGTPIDDVEALAASMTAGNNEVSDATPDSLPSDAAIAQTRGPSQALVDAINRASQKPISDEQKLGPQFEQPPGPPEQPSEAPLTRPPLMSGPSEEARGATGDDETLWNAQEADRKSHLTAGMELAGRQLVAGITNTKVGEGIGAAPSQVPQAMHQADLRRKAITDAIARKRQGTMDASTLKLQESETAKNNRVPAAKPVNELSDEYTRWKMEHGDQELAAREADQKRKAAAKAPHGGGQTDDSIARATALYQLPPPSPRQKNYAEVMGAILKIDPNYDGSRYATYQHTRENQATNPSLLAGKAVAHHMDELQKAVDELPEGMIDSPMANKAAQSWDDATGAGKYTRIKTAASVVGSELAQALGDKDMAGREHVARLVDPAQTKAQWAKSLPELIRLRDEKIGTSAEVLHELGPKSGAKPSPGAGYKRGTVAGKAGWYNSETNDWEAD